MIRHGLIPFVVVVVGLSSAGCIDLPLVVHGAVEDGTGGGLPGDRNGEEPDRQGDATVPVVRLDVSNPSPQLNEEVILTCSVAAGDAGGVSFGFQPPDGRLFVNRRSGTAVFIVEEADIGSAFMFTCTGTNKNGTSEPSNEQLIIPSS